MIKGVVNEHRMRKLLRLARHKPINIYVLFEGDRLLERRILDKNSKFQRKDVSGNPRLYYTNPKPMNEEDKHRNLNWPGRDKIFLNYWHAYAYLQIVKQRYYA